MSNQKRTLGDRLLNLEVLINEIIDKDELQYGDVLYLIYGHLIIHRPDAQEQYVDGGSPIFYYGPKKEKD